MNCSNSDGSAGKFLLSLGSRSGGAARTISRPPPSAAPTQFSIQVVMIEPHTPGSVTQQLWPFGRVLTFSTRREILGCAVSTTVNASS